MASLYRKKKDGKLFLLKTIRCGCVKEIDYFTNKESKKTVNLDKYVKVADLVRV